MQEQKTQTTIVSKSVVEQEDVEVNKDRSRRYIVLIAGVEFPRYESLGKGKGGHKSKKTHWALRRGRFKPIPGLSRKKCLSVAEHTLKKDPTIRAIIFDFFTGTRETFVLRAGKLEMLNKRNYGQLVATNYRYRTEISPDYFVLRPIRKSSRRLLTTQEKEKPQIRYYPSVSKISPDKDVPEKDYFSHFQTSNGLDQGLSFLHVLKMIQWIGRKRPYSLLQIHFFGHASGSHQAGPAFVNTDDWYRSKPKVKRSGVPRYRRHPLDQDARADLDFNSNNINRVEFRKAFALEATSYVWGCNWSRPIHRMIMTSAKAVRDNLRLDAKRKNIIFKYDSTYGKFKNFSRAFSVSKEEDKGQRTKIKRSLTFVKRILQGLMKKSYMQKLANASNHCVVGGLPGTYSGNDEIRYRGGQLLMHIPMGEKYYRDLNKSSKPDNFLRHLGFYQAQFSTKFSSGRHPKYGRGYGLYVPDEL